MKIIKIALVLMVFPLILFFLFSYDTIFTSEGMVMGGFQKITEKYFFIKAKTTSANNNLLKGEENDRINVLLLGIGGKGHEGANLTDTMIIASYKPSEKKVALMSLPRDLLVYMPDYAWRKINHVYYFAEKESPNSGGKAAAKFISDLLDIPIQYHITVNFDGFTHLIDALGGIDVNVENLLDDPQYPIKGKENDYPISHRYEHLHLEPGMQKMDGNLALKYARSRHAGGKEGSDYARSRRQQKIIIAIKKKTLSFKTLINPTKLKKILNVVSSNIQTNFNFPEIYRIIGFARKFDSSNIINKVIDASPNGPLQENHYNGAFVLEPKTGNFDELKFIAKYIFKKDKNYHRQKNPTPLLSSNHPQQDVTREQKTTSLGTAQEKTPSTVEIRNGTFIEGFASKQAAKLRKLGFNVILIGNAQKQTYRKTVIYPLNKDNSRQHINLLKNNFSSNILNTPAKQVPSSTADFLIILGSDLYY